VRAGPLRPLRPYLAPEWPALAVAMLSTTAVVLAWLARPLPLALVVDQVVQGRSAPFELSSDDWRLVALVGVLVVGIALVNALGSHLADDRLARAGERITHRLRMATYEQLQRLSLTFHERSHAGDLVTRVTSDVSAVGSLFSDALGGLASAGMLLLGMLVVSLLIDPLLALTAFAAAPVLALLSYRFRGRVKSMARRQRAKAGEIAALSEESISAVRVVKSLGAESFEQERLRRRSEELRDLEFEASGLEGRFSGITDVVGAFALALVLVVGVARVAAGAVTLGELVIMWTYARRIDRPLRTMARSANRAARGFARAERVAEVLAADEVLEERPGAYAGPPPRGELALRNVSFSYDAERPALVDLTLRVPAGERIALMGRSGAGKSTLAALIARFYDPPAGGGAVLIDGRDLRDCSLAWVREQVGLVLQDTMLFTGTVAENIAYGREASVEEVIAAARAAAAHEFISELPDGYDSMLGPRGVGLSGGQRQRIAIARTLLRDPPILVLDEPTTGLDAGSEAEVLEGLDALMRGRTTVIVTHSTRLARTADRLVVVDAGRAVRDGPPEEVLRVEASLGPGPRRAAGDRGTGRGRGPGAPPVLDDPALPHMADVLDPERMAGVLERSLGDRAAPLDAQVRYLRYKPQTNLVVHYDVRIEGRRHDATAMIAGADLGRRARKPRNVALARLVNGRSPAEHPLFYDSDVGALVQWLPLDLSLPAFAEPLGRLNRLLAAAGVHVVDDEAEPSLLAYKPRRRAVLRYGDHVLKYYCAPADYDASLAGLLASSAAPGVRTPRFEAALPDLLVTVQSHVDGRPVAAREAAPHAGRALARLHSGPAGGLAPFPPAAQLEAARASARLVCHIAPELRRRVEDLVASLEERMPAAGEPVPTHGDFNARQLLEQDDRLVLTDFDAMAAAPPGLDLATYFAYLVSGGVADVEAAFGTLASLLEGYGQRPPELPWYLATMVLRRAPRPFRYQDEDWPERVERMVAAAETVAR
jgi:ATP-binding cassette, subfamily B, bacterial